MKKKVIIEIVQAFDGVRNPNGNLINEQSFNEQLHYSTLGHPVYINRVNLWYFAFIVFRMHFFPYGFSTVERMNENVTVVKHIFLIPIIVMKKKKVIMKIVHVFDGAISNKSDQYFEI